jgi:hypothetical protein
LDCHDPRAICGGKGRTLAGSLTYAITGERPRLISFGIVPPAAVARGAGIVRIDAFAALNNDRRGTHE